MTHSGGKPHAVGDRGQRYEVTYLDGDERKVCGWSDTIAGAERMRDAIDLHPVWCEPATRDRLDTLSPLQREWARFREVTPMAGTNEQQQAALKRLWLDGAQGALVALKEMNPAGLDKPDEMRAAVLALNDEIMAAITVFHGRQS